MAKLQLSNSNIQDINVLNFTRSGLIILLMILILNMRPAIMGQLFGAIYSGLLVTLIAIIAFWKRKIYLKKGRLKYIAAAVMMAMYVFFQILFVGFSSFSGAIATLAYIFIGVLIILIIDRDKARNFSKVLIGICVLFGISYLITYINFLVFGNSYTVYIINLPTHTDYVYELEILFPFSPVYNGTANIAGLKMPRAIGMMREPGLYQMVLIIAYWLQDLYKFRYNIFIKFILIFSLIITFSTAGYALLLGTIMWKMFKNLGQNRLKYLIGGIPVVLILFYVLIFSESQFGIIEKFDSQSGASRLGATIVSLELIKENPLFGIGFHLNPNNVEIGINYLGTIAQLGIIGSLIFLMPIFYTWLKIKDGPIQVVNIFIVLVLTMLLAQPIYDKPLTFLFLSMLLVIGVKTKKDLFFKNKVLIKRHAA
ncbi:hypothetical protein BH23BAC3_BH23BAC3_14230 [soil metagenome]